MRTKEERIVAVLHDVIEDTEYSIEDLRKAGYSEGILKSLDHLTHRGGESYKQFIERVKPDSLARRVKIEDLKDNLDLSRIKRPKEKDLRRADKYRCALKELLRVENGFKKGSARKR